MIKLNKIIICLLMFSLLLILPSDIGHANSINMDNNAVYIITTQKNSSSYGTVSGGGQYLLGQQAIIKAIPKKGYRFVKWGEGSETVSNSATYCFAVSCNRTLKAYFASIGTPSLILKVTGHSTVQINTKPVPYASGYELWRAKSSHGSYKHIATLTGTLSYLDTNLDSGTKYYYKAVAFCLTDSTKSYGKYSYCNSITPNWSIPSLSVKITNYHTASLNWNVIAEADGYEVYRSTSSKRGYTKIADISAPAHTYQDIGLTYGKTYYYKIRPYDNSDTKNKFGLYSRYRYVTPKWPALKAKASLQDHNYVLISYNAIAGADGYELSMGTSRKGPFKRLPEDIYGTSYFIQGLKSGKAYYFKVRAYDKIGDKKVFGPLSGYAYIKPKWSSIIDPSHYYANSIAVFGYHNFAPDSIKNTVYIDGDYTDATGDLERQLAYLHENGYRTLSLTEFYAWQKGDLDLPYKSVLLTFDDGYLSFYYEVLPILERYKMRATVFVVGSYISGTSPVYNPNKIQHMGMDLIQRLIDNPLIEVQSHSYNLHRYIDGKVAAIVLSKEEIEQDFEKMEKYHFDVFCYPYGAYSEILLEVLKECKYRMAFMFGPSAKATRENNPYQISRIKMRSYEGMQDFIKWLD